MGKIVDVSDIINEVLDESGLSRVVDLINVNTALKKVLGATIYNNTKILSLKHKILYIGVPTAVWACELSFMKDSIIDGLNESMGKSLIEDIRFIGG